MPPAKSGCGVGLAAQRDPAAAEGAVRAARSAGGLVGPGLRARALAEMQALARRQRAIFIKIDPEVLLGSGYPGQRGRR